VSFRKCPHNREALPDDRFYCQRNSSQRVGDEKSLAALGPSFFERRPKVAPVEAAKEMFRIFQESEMNDFDRIATGDESWFQHTTTSSKMFARLVADVIPRTQQAVRANKTMIPVFFTAKKLGVFDAFPRGHIFNQVYFINNRFLDLKTAYLNFRRQRTGSTSWVHMGHNGLKVSQKLRRATFPECRTRPIHQI
jgi:hypothetical protein